MTSPQTFKPSEGKREEFRKYLEKAGIMDALTKVLVNLYEEVDKPEDALTYIIEKLSLQAGLETHKQINSKLEEALGQIKELEMEVESLKTKIQETEGGAVSAHSAHPEEGTGEEQPTEEQEQ